MTNHLDLLLDLLNFDDEERQSFLAIGKVIAQHTDKKLVIHHRMGFVFEARRDLLLEKITLEEFLAVGDISSMRPLLTEFHSSLALLQSPKTLEKIEQDSMLLIDEISFLILSKAEQDKLQKTLEKKNILLLLC